MDAAEVADCSSSRPLQRKRKNRKNFDRFIPNRSVMDFDYSNFILTSKNNNRAPKTVSSRAYRKLLDQTFNMNRTQILVFKNKPSTPCLDTILSDDTVVHPKTFRYIPKTYERRLDAPGFVDDYYLNLLDWGNCNVLAVTLGNAVYMCDPYVYGSVSEFVIFYEEIGPVTSVKWTPDGRHIAVGINNSQVQLWDAAAQRLICTLRGCHSSRVGAMDWNNENLNLTTGGMDGKIVNNDVRIADHIVKTYREHQQEICGLRWSASGQQLASGGNDNLLHIWDHRSTVSSNSPKQWLHRLQEHTAAVKTLVWCSF